MPKVIKWKVYFAIKLARMQTFKKSVNWSANIVLQRWTMYERMIYQFERTPCIWINHYSKCCYKESCFIECSTIWNFSPSHSSFMHCIIINALYYHVCIVLSFMHCIIIYALYYHLCIVLSFMHCIIIYALCFQKVLVLYKNVYAVYACIASGLIVLTCVTLYRNNIREQSQSLNTWLLVSQFKSVRVNML